MIKQDGPYDTRTLTKIFALSSLALGATVVWMVIDDHSRSWKNTQEAFRTIELAQAQARLDDAERSVNASELDKRKAELKAAQDELDKHSGDRKKLEDELKKAQAEYENAALTYSITKSYVDTENFFYPELSEQHRVAQAQEHEKLWDIANASFDQAAAEREAADLKVKKIKGELAALEARFKDAQARVDEMTSDAEKAKKKVEQIGHNFENDWFRNRPMVDFLDPTIKVKQVVLNDIRDDIYFAQVKKVDRCTTCHLAIDRRGFDGEIVHVEGRGLIPVKKAVASGTNYELEFADGHKELVESSKVQGDKIEIQAPFQSHPNLDLYLGSTSPHPVEKFGCTVCHLGEGQSLSFSTAAHTPNGEDQRKEWEEKHGWQIREHWNETQFPTRYVEASCVLCHANNRPVPGADKLNFGREVWERLSCVGCHKMKGYEDEAKRGPDLRRVTKKLTKDFVAYWIDDPTRFRPKTNMPRFFHHSTPTAEEKKEAATPSPDDKTKVLYNYDIREGVEIRGITEWLFDRSAAFQREEEARGEAFTLPDWKKGDASRGKALFTARGCVGCHKVDKADAESLRTYAPDEFGPNLYNTGNKVKPDWVQAWVMNPKHYWAETKMPVLRISESDARDIATWLCDGIVDKDGKSDVKDASLPGWKPLGNLTEAETRELEVACRDYLAKDYPTPDIEEILAGKPSEPSLPKLGDTASRLLYLGEQSVGRYGCFGCHLIKGMETRPGIGRDLTDIGDKNLTQVDWGFESVKKDAKEKPAGKIRENRHEWLNLKIEDPRIFDRGKPKGPLDRSRMPQFKTTKLEREALVTYLLGQTGNRKVPEEYRYRPSARKAYEVEGEYQIHRNNCKACHLFAADKIAFTAPTPDGKGEAPITRPLVDPKSGELIRSPITGEPILSKAWVDGLVLVDNTKLYGKDGTAIVQLFADPPAGVTAFGDRKAGDFIPVLADGDFRSLDVKSPIYGAEADLEKVIAKMPADVFGDDPKTQEENRAKQLAAVRKGIASRNRGGMSLEKIILARASAKLGFDPMDPSEEAHKKFDPTDASLASTFKEAKNFGPPHLLAEGRKVQALWLQTFLKNPVEIRPALRPATGWDQASDTSILDAGGPHMPTYGFHDSDAQVYSRYFAARDEDRRIDLARNDLDEIQKKVKIKEGEKGHEPGYHSRFDIQNKVYAALDKYDAREYFNLTIVDGVFNYAGRGDVSLELALDEKNESYMVEREKGKGTSGGPGWYGAAYRMFVHPSVNCQKCHIIHGQTPQGTADAWAPDLGNVRERLQPEYIQRWVENPQAIIPGTLMPQLFIAGNLQNVLPGSPSVQVSAVVDWLMAGAPAVLEVYPKVADQPGTVVKAGGEVFLTSELLNLEEVKTIEISTGSGTPDKVQVTPAMREKSAERTTALKLPIQASAKGKTYVITITDGRFTASADVNVAGD